MALDAASLSFAASSGVVVTSLLLAAASLFQRDDELIRTTFCLEALSHVHCAVGAASHLLLLPAEMKIMLLRIANGPAALIA